MTTDGNMAKRDARALEEQLGWQSRLGWGVCLISAYVVLVCLPLLLAAIAHRAGGEPLLHELGLGAALLAFSLLTFQVLLAGRFHSLTSPFGLDAVMQFHKAMAILAGVLLMSHPLLLALGEGNWHLLTLDTPWQVWLGKISLALLVLGIGYALLTRYWRLPYQTWRRLHKGMVVVVILGFIHSLLLGGDLEAPALRAYWFGLFGVALLVFLWRNAVVPIWGRRRFRVADVQPASHDTYTLRLEPVDGKGIPRWNPGQFMFLKLIRPGRSSEEHPFTISASPSEPDHLAATIKQSGDFTDTIDRTQPGDEARVEHPFGRFSYVYHRPKPLLFIAGGVGITPIRSMLRCLIDSGDNRRCVLIYGNKTENDILFRTELENLSDDITVAHVLSEPTPGWQGETGYVTDKIIRRYAEALLTEADVYICGPSAMMDSVFDGLHRLDVGDSRIHYEQFSL